MKYIISYDLGTGGTKASLFNEFGISCESAFVSCDTTYPMADFREQRPEDWWNSVVISTREMLEKAEVLPEDIAALAVSGHSLGAVPIGKNGTLLAESVPVWNDARAGKEAEEFFLSVKEDEWYETTGNGFPAPLYAVFKMMWYRNHRPDLYENTEKFIGTKDYVNYKMTGILCTDHSYASGSGVYSLKGQDYVNRYIEASGIVPEKFPDIFPSTQIIGTIRPEAAAQLGLSPETQVACGGVDNACMALGAACFQDGEAYTSLGTSAWIAVSSREPVVNKVTHPYVFAHCVPGQYVSALSIFSAGNSYRWVKNTLCKDLVEAQARGRLADAYEAMNEEAVTSPPGANKLLFNPSLAGGSGIDKSRNIRGGFIGLDLMHTRADLIRATLEGICLNMRMVMDELGKDVNFSEEMLLVGGGGKSRFWRQLFADIYEKRVVETNVGEDAGSLGAAAVAAVGCGMWSDFQMLKTIHKTVDVAIPKEEQVTIYQEIMPVFKAVADLQSEIGEKLTKLL